jgi:hypothetical protein
MKKCFLQKLEKPLYTLMPLDEFKALAGVDDREDKTARFCLVTSTFTIEQYCKRRFLRKKYSESLHITRDLLFPLKEYPVNEILSVFAMTADNPTGKIIEPEFYRPMLGCDYNEDLPFELLLSPSLRPYRLAGVKVIYWAGYKAWAVPADLASACLELAAWNMNRYRGRRIGMTGTIRGTGKDGEHFEMSMPENVRSLLEPYRRKVI